MINSGEILFVKSVKDGIPNRDPLNDSNARRIFGEEDGRISLSDVSIKRDIRDYVAAKYPDGGKTNYIFVREERTPEGKLLGRSSLAEEIKKKSEHKSAKMQEVLTDNAFDVRTFGIVYSVKKETFKLTGPVQFGWAHSMHPVESQYIQGTVVMPSSDIKNTAEGAETKEVGQGTIWTSYIVPFAVFAVPAIINANIAKESKMKPEDVDLLLEGLWNGTKHRQARGRGIQQPLFLLHIEYNDPMFRIGYLEEGVKLVHNTDEKTPNSLEDICLDLQVLEQTIKSNIDKIKNVRYWIDNRIKTIGNIEGTLQKPW
ncbi:CRISPR-associated protein, Csd2/Csh2 family [Candidatus Syntrophocurvum alkaliphilum]|uniref:CRISPR-associated protein, Csd2/Csh2 family n=1 Tax=Candidatus Syntrophocurvum alkaliphilum TaxID=2293317 RepID=A0A6I6DFU5_9FIRM|nr:type I CRISPR-associated protein Cas7 [Candidatus Syntrophocurvum alkaliphilum]QGT99802.1 CRISPR-associated protein, Csd2/Csh2 family [Candidatus Syntrophocurvum alkaliphilum]